ncbi:MAG: O-antigen ligase family protein [Pseudomonadota bacterium]
MPWITAIRLVTVPLALVMLIALSISRDFREEMTAILAPSSIVTKLLLAFVVISFLSIAVSAKPMVSFNKFIVAQISWTLIFFVSCFVFSRRGLTNRFCYILWGCALFTCAIGLWEWQIQRLPWAGHIPSFLKVEEELLAGLLSASARSATGLYRVKSIFTTPLGLGEFLALATPIILHIVLTSRNVAIKAAGVASLLVILMVLLRTDSRLGMVGYFMTFLLTILTWAALNWRANRKNIIAQGVLLFYPVIFALFIAATFFVRRLEVLVWGSGAQQASTDARGTQIEMGLPKILTQPWGHGIGQGAEALGFRSPTGILTIDTYYLAAALEFGVIGFFVFFGMFAVAIFTGGKAVLDVKDKEVALLAPLCIAIANFFVIKSVFSQLSNHPLVFAMLGAIVGLVYRAKTDPTVARIKASG